MIKYSYDGVLKTQTNVWYFPSPFRWFFCTLTEKNYNFYFITTYRTNSKN